MYIDVLYVMDELEEDLKLLKKQALSQLWCSVWFGVENSAFILV